MSNKSIRFEDKTVKNNETNIEMHYKCFGNECEFRSFFKFNFILLR